MTGDEGWLDRPAPPLWRNGEAPPTLPPIDDALPDWERRGDAARWYPGHDGDEG